MVWESVLFLFILWVFFFDIFARRAFGMVWYGKWWANWLGMWWVWSVSDGFLMDHLIKSGYCRIWGDGRLIGESARVEKRSDARLHWASG